MSRTVLVGIPREEILREKALRKQQEWPMSLGTVVCPNCQSTITVEDDIDLMLLDTYGYAETVDAYLRCPNCWDGSLFSADIHLFRRKVWQWRGFFPRLDWKTTIKYTGN